MTYLAISYFANYQYTHTHKNTTYLAINYIATPYTVKVREVPWRWIKSIRASYYCVRKQHIMPIGGSQKIVTSWIRILITKHGSNSFSNLNADPLARALKWNVHHNGFIILFRCTRSCWQGLSKWPTCLKFRETFKPGLHCPASVNKFVNTWSGVSIDRVGTGQLWLDSRSMLDKYSIVARSAGNCWCICVAFPNCFEAISVG